MKQGLQTRVIRVRALTLTIQIATRANIPSAMTMLPTMAGIKIFDMNTGISSPSSRGVVTGVVPAGMLMDAGVSGVGGAVKGTVTVMSTSCCSVWGKKNSDLLIMSFCSHLWVQNVSL